MPSIIIAENGTGDNPLANSYAVAQDAKDYAALRGLTLPSSSDDLLIEQALILAMDLLETYKFKGKKTNIANPLEWPRKCVLLEDAEEALADDEIPAAVIRAQCQFCYDSTLTDLQPTGTGKEVIREKVDVLEVEYAAGSGGSVTPQFNKAESILAPYLENGGGFSLKSIRV